VNEKIISEFAKKNMYNILIEDIASSVVVSKQVVAGVDNLVCTRRGTTEVIVEYNHDSVFYAMF
jgi:hypothetical protein